MKLLVSLLCLLASSLVYGDAIDGDFEQEVEKRNLRRKGRGHGGGGGWRGGGRGGFFGNGGGGNGGNEELGSNNVDEDCDGEDCDDEGDQNDIDWGHHGDLIHKLLDSNRLIQRTVNRTSTGITAHTWSDDEQVDTWIQQHVAQMQHFMENGRRIRQRDPLFVAVFDNAPLIDFDYITSDDEDDEKESDQDNEGVDDDSSIDMVIDQGVFVKETSTDPCAIAIIQAHADAVSGFIETGRRAMHQNHEVPDICFE